MPVRPVRHALIALVIAPAVSLGAPAPAALAAQAPAGASASVAAASAGSFVGASVSAGELSTGLRRTPRMGVATEFVAGVEVPVATRVAAAGDLSTGLRRTPRMGVEVAGDLSTGLRRTPRMGVDTGVTAGAEIPAGLRRTPRMDVALTAWTGLTAAVSSASAAAAPAAGHAVASTRQASLATRLLGAKRSSTRWFSGAWTGGYMSGARAEAFGRWRGTPLDAVTTYPDKRTWASIRNSEWHITTFRSTPGRLVYGLPLLPDTGPGTLADVARGRYDSVFRQVAIDLKKNGRGNSIVRIGFEANGTWFRYGGTAKNAATWKAAYRRVAKVMKATSPKLLTNFDITCGFAMPGSTHRLDSLTKLYPGDDVVDLIGCDMYDEWQTKARNAAQFRQAIRPRATPGLADVAAFARARGKGMTIPEWGVAYPGRNGNGDNPYFITAMRSWMRANADVLVLENYFNDAAGHVRSDLWGGQNPKAAAAYRTAW